MWHALTTEAASVWHSTAVNITTVGGPFWVSLGISVCAFAEWLVECRGIWYVRLLTETWLVAGLVGRWVDVGLRPQKTEAY